MNHCSDRRYRFMTTATTTSPAVSAEVSDANQSMSSPSSPAATVHAATTSEQRPACRTTSGTCSRGTVWAQFAPSGRIIRTIERNASAQLPM